MPAERTAVERNGDLDALAATIASQMHEAVSAAAAGWAGANPGAVSGATADLAAGVVRVALSDLVAGYLRRAANADYLLLSPAGRRAPINVAAAVGRLIGLTPTGVARRLGGYRAPHERGGG